MSPGEKGGTDYWAPRRGKSKAVGRGMEVSEGLDTGFYNMDEALHR
jgi:hypothetical protein